MSLCVKEEAPNYKGHGQHVKTDSDASQLKLVSIDKIKNQLTFLPTQRGVSISDDDDEEEESDDEVQFVKAERVYPTAPSKTKLTLPVPEVVKSSTEEVKDDPLSVKKSFPCSQCKKILSTAEDLVKHLQIRHTKKPRIRKKVPTEPDGPRDCQHCGQTFEKRNSWAAHMNAHKGQKPKLEIECKECGEKFESRGILHRHRKQAHITVFNCKICRSTFVTENAHEAHMKRHSEQVVSSTPSPKKPSFMCDICSKTFNLAKSLETHMYTHTGEKPFRCDVCESAFTSAQCLRLHQKIHLGIKNYECTLCGKKFIDASKLKKHGYVHSKKKPHVCHHCGKGFVFPFFLRQHLRVHSGEKPYKCIEDGCTREFISNHGLKEHINSVHKGMKRPKVQTKKKMDFSTQPFSPNSQSSVVTVEYQECEEIQNLSYKMWQRSN